MVSQTTDKLSQGTEVLDGKAVLSDEQIGDDPDKPPTPEEWKTMKGYGSFISETYLQLCFFTLLIFVQKRTMMTMRNTLSVSMICETSRRPAVS